jgi:SAM-dependent methyltransferase
MGQLQFDFLVKQGLKPEDRLLDIGCGSLRGGVHFVRYLEPGRYVGVDSNPRLLELGRERELSEAVYSSKRVRLVAMNDFGFARLGEQFDYALAQSVFTHLPFNAILRCLSNVTGVLAPGGKLYATIFLHDRPPGDVEALRHEPGGIVTQLDRDPYHYSLEMVQWAAEWAGLKAEHIGEWGHPRDQRMVVFAPDK